MTSVNGLNGSSLLLQLMSRPASASQVQSVSQPLTPVHLEQLVLKTQAVKSVSTSIFNAVINASDEKKSTVDAVIDFIDRNYTNFDKKFANVVAFIGPAEMSTMTDYKAIGESLKQSVLSDPDNMYNIVKQIRTSRPSISQDGVFGLAIARLKS